MYMYIKEFAVIHLRSDLTPRNWVYLIRKSGLPWYSYKFMEWVELEDSVEDYRRVYIPMLPGIYKVEVEDLADSLHGDVVYIECLESYGHFMSHEDLRDLYYYDALQMGVIRHGR